MDKPHIAAKAPVVLELEPGTYWWCACGLSKDQPWCDGTHKSTSFSPVQLEIETKKKVALCACKQSEKGAYCDGAHKGV